MFIPEKNYPSNSPVVKAFSQITVPPREPLRERGVEGTFAKTPPNGFFHFPNSSKQVWAFKKHTQVADVRAAIDWDTAKIAKLYSMDEKELQNFEPTTASDI